MKNEITHIFPATSLQQGFIYHALSQTEDDAYRVQVLLDYHETIDTEKYLQAWEYCINQYPILRTAFNWKENIIQVIYKYGKLKYELHDISHLASMQEKNEAIVRIQVEDRRRRFDLTQPTLFRLHIIKLSATYYTVLKTEHHSIADGWSGPVLLASLHNYYHTLKDNKKVNIKEDVAYLRTQEYIYKNKNVIREYWRTTLVQVEGVNDINALLSQSIDIINYKQVEQPVTNSLEITGSFYNTIKIFSQKEGITLNVIVQFIWHKLLQVYSNSLQSIVGTTISGRDLPIEGIEESVGLYINTLPLIINWENDNTIQAQLHQIQQEITELNTHGFAQLAKLQKNGERLFHSLFVYENYPAPKASEEAMKISIRNAIEKVDYPLSIIAYEYNDALIIKLQYDGNYLTREKAERHIETIKYIFHQVVENPEKSHTKISLLNREEQKKIIYDWNATDKEYPKDKMSYQLFEEQVKITPDNNALVYEGQQLTYKELNEKSNQLAHYIRKQYEKRTKQPLVSDTLIALCLDRSLEMVVGILAVLKAGGAYVPMDPAYPKERIDHILEDIRTELILTQRHLAGEGMQLPLDKVIYIELTEKIYKEEERSNLPQYSKATNLAYVIYTSGTTGKPKGVEITFSNLNNLIFVQKSKFEINSKSKVLQFASLVFDASVWEIFSALSFGAQLSIVSTNIRQNVHLLCDYLEDHQINVATLPPVLLNTMPHKKFSTLRILIVAGESCPTELMVKWSQGRKLINAYGPTENTVCATMHEFREGDINTNIGKPLDNVSVYVLDNTSNSVPIGVIGELYIGGAGLSRGYLNRPDLTSERFIVNPFATESDHAKGYARLYKTGDLVRWLSDGNLEYIGRNDDQVKIRGHRIELGEIENVLSQITGIKQSCVLAKERKIETGSPKYLVAYYVLDNKSDVLSQTTIRDKLAQMLPEYMVPSILVAVETFPLTINGKLDKQALPDPDFGYVAEEYVIPTNEIETTLSKIWQEVLGLERVGITDNFFRIGGDSILSIQVSSRIRQAGFNCQVKDIFEYKIIAKLAEHLSKKNSELALQSEQGILTGDAGLLPIQQWFLEKVDSGELVHPNHWNQSFLVRVEELETTKLVTIVEELVDYHDVLRMTYIKDQVTRQSTNGEAIWKQVYQSSIEIPELRILNVSKHGATEIQQILTSWQSEFDLERGPLFQVGYLYGYEDGSARIYFALHHTIVDGVSWRILTDDIKSLYEGRRLTPKGSSYRQWVESVKSYTKEHLSEADYWRTQLNAIPDYHKGVNEQESSVAFIELDKKLTRSLLQEAPKAYHTEINDLLLTTLAYALKEINGNAIQGVTLEGHGREEIDATIDHSRTVGWFTSVFPVKLELQNNLEESIRFIKESLRSIPNKGLCFGVFATSKAISYTYKDLAPISFNYLGQFDIQEGYWQIVSESSGESIHPANTEQNLISINGMVSNGKLMFSVVTKLGDDTTKQLSAAFKTHLTAIIEHCNEKLEKEGSSYTPSDFHLIEHEGDLSNLSLVKNSVKMYEPFAMTEIQKAYLLGRLDTFEIGGVSNHVYYEFKFTSLVNITKLERVTNVLINNYPELRTVFDIETLTQRYLEPSKFKPYRLNSDKYKNNYCEDQIISIRNKLSHHVYDAGQFPLFTFHISRFNDCDILHVSIDLILLDAESRRIFFNTIDKLYRNDIFTLIPSKLNFKDYQDYVAFLKYSKWYTKDKHYWTSKLEQLPLRPELLLKCDAKSISKPKFNISHRLVEEVTWGKFKSKASNYGISTSAALLSLFGYVLSKYSATKDFLITLTVFSRYSIHPEVNSIWGDFTSTSLFGYRNMKGAIKDKLLLTHQDLWNDLSHGLFNGIEVQRELQNMHKLDPFQAVSPIIFTGKVGGDSSMQKNSTDQSFLDNSENVASRLWVGQTSQAWIDLQAIEVGNQFKSDWMYVEQLFDKEFIEKLNADYCNLIEYLAEADWEDQLPEVRLSEHDQTIIEGANNYHQLEIADTLVDICLSGIIDHANRTAVIDAKGRYTYAEIGAYSYGIAGYLYDHGLSKPNHLIGILSEKGYQQVVSTLGIMQSGAAYLPLNVDWPQGRINEVLEEGFVKTVLISRSEFRDSISGSELQSKYKWLIIEEITSYEPQVNAVQLPEISLGDIAYVIFTSGSTGKPKGVIISHRGAVNTIVAVNRRLDISQDDKVLALSELSFDLSVYDIFGLLAVGGAIVFPDQEKTKEPSHWYDLVNKHRITLWDTVPQLMQLLVDYVIDINQALPMLKAVLLSGDWIPVKLPSSIHSLNKETTVMSLGGATEGSIWSIWYEVDQIDSSWTSIPYGQAMPNQKMYILNEFGEYCPAGVKGDIYIGGEGVALGYWNDKTKTDANFIAHRKLGKLYKTGDLGKWNKRGYMEFEGRKDNQVKLNGYRVELDEISSRLTTIEGIDKALVRIQDNQLVAYLVSDKLKVNKQKENVREKISDKKEIEQFKLEQHGIRKELLPIYKLKTLCLNEKRYRLRKSYRQFESEDIHLTKEYLHALIALGLSLDSTIKIDEKKANEISIETLKKILEPLSAIKLSDKVLPKYLYPSGGSTYAIQCYVDVLKDMINLKQGLYYYEPVSHYLAGVEGQASTESKITKNKRKDKNNTSIPSITLKFKLYKSAIVPLYGDDIALRLGWLEMGHILALLETQLAIAHLDCQLRIVDEEAGAYHHFVELEISCLEKGQQASLLNEEYKQGVLIDYLLKNSQGFNDQEGHEYRLDHSDIITKLSDFRQLLESAQGLIVFKGSTAPLSLINSGYHAQLLTDQLYNQNIGSCALGFVPYEDVNYIIAIGQISEEQKNKSEIQPKSISLEVSIKQKIKHYLPLYMLPNYYIPLDEMPLTANGKVDYKQLPTIEMTQTEFVLPRTKMEQKACEIWQEVLGLKKVGITDDFFKIGGNSILAIRVSHQMNKSLGFDVRVADVFRLTSINQIFNSIHKTHGLKLVKSYYSRYNSNLTDMIFIHPGIAGCEVYQSLADLLATNFNCIGIDNYNIHNTVKISSLNKLADLYLSKIEQEYSLAEPINILAWSLGGNIALEMSTILEMRGFKDINVTLLDTMVVDEKMRNLNKQVDRVEFVNSMRSSFVKRKYEEEYIEKVISAMDAEEELSDSVVSCRLKYTQVTLFKAMQKDTGMNDEIFKYTMTLVANNVELIADKVEAINLDCQHGNILDNIVMISNYLLSKVAINRMKGNELYV